MDLLQKSLSEAINKNTAETSKWEKYLEEMRQAETSLRDFQKKLQVDCMVPIGTKALMPGHLYHTSEILVGNGNKVFSKCTTFDALKICKHRQTYAEKRLKELETERDLHKNKLELPFMQNAFGNQEGQEIIEEYDEQKEAEWRKKHRESVAAQKKKERMERETAKNEEKTEKSHEEVMNLLDELELMDELEEELANLNVQTDDQLQKLMSGELQPPKEKKRIAHSNNFAAKKDVVVDGSVLPEEKSEVEPKKVPETQNIPQEIQENPQVEPIPEPEIVVPELESPPDEGNYTGESESESESDIDSSTVSEQVYSKWKEMLEASKNLSRKNKKHYLKQKLKDVNRSLQELVVHDVDTLTIRIDLNDLKDLIEDEIIRIAENKQEEEILEENPEIPAQKSKNEEKRRSKISFAEEDDVKLIDKHEAPCKVGENLSLVTPEMPENNGLTRFITFHHSEWPVMEPCKEDENEVASPMDVYHERFGYFPKEKPQVVQSPSISKENSCEDLKSILKNKEKVLQETHREVPKPVKKEKKLKPLTEATNLLGDVVERPVDYQPKTVKDEPKQKVSKFKANRNKNKS
ncbi:unconventional prefoldin RPB5 interactor-like protein [Culicoides brevitarsis]|uniref:unconventional prefoldin RPB5 interactor-like protein n=1 Tax=Culicoides brevitarsis TaxID=469753 RepID=UPI00307C0303